MCFWFLMRLCEEWMPAFASESCATSRQSKVKRIIAGPIWLCECCGMICTAIETSMSMDAFDLPMEICQVIKSHYSLGIVGVCSQTRERTTNCDMWHIYLDLLLFNCIGRERESERERVLYIYT